VQSRRKRSDIVAYFKSKGALDATSAVELPSDHRLSQSVIADMLSHGDLTQTAVGTYWLNYERAVRRQERTKKLTDRVLTIVSAVGAMAAVAILALR
jgi:predicted transcriptional regulator